MTIDEAEHDLPHIFDMNGDVALRNLAELPRELPLLYARLTQGRT